jgi:transcriptional regulator with XRE-family HTH domain
MTQAKAPKAAPAAEQDSPDADKAEVGRRIKQQRERHGWTLDELSQATKQIDPQQQGVSKVSISRYENADSYPGYREIKLIAQALSEPITHFFYGDMPDPNSGWHMSLDEYLRHVIKDVLIEEGVLPGQTMRDKEFQKADAQSAVNRRRQRFTASSDPADKADKAALKRQQQADILHSAEALERQLSSGKRANAAANAGGKGSKKG